MPIRVTDIDSGNFGESAATFVINPDCAITVLIPNGGESLCVGDAVDITLNHSACCCASVRIELLLYGNTCEMIAASTSNDGLFEWTVVQCGGYTDGYAIMVTDLASGIWDASDETFTINFCGIYDWDFAISDHGFTTTMCDLYGVPVWEYGSTVIIPGAPGDVWGTVLNGEYYDESGEGLLSPPFVVGDSFVMEIHHYFDIETNYDGCNVSVDGNVITPMAGYTVPELSPSASFYAMCVDLEPGWTGHDAVWIWSLFDLSPFIGQEIQVEFDFGSDASVTYRGWYIASVWVGPAGDRGARGHSR